MQRAAAAEVESVRHELEGVAQQARARDHEKDTTHDISGWDRKPRGQIREEEEAKAHALAQARAGIPYAPIARKAGQASWENESVTEHSVSGWTRKTRGQAVQDAARREYENEVDRLSTPPPVTPPPNHPPQVKSGFARDQYNNSYNVNGTRAVNRLTGQICRIDGGNRIRC